MEETRANSPVRKKLAPFYGGLYAVLLEAAALYAILAMSGAGGVQ